MKRAADIFLSMIAMLLLLPLMLVLLLLISLESSGGPFFLQSRVGKDGKDFKLIKLRTMLKGSDRYGLLTVGGRDPRVTPLGYFLRKYKLDELPQLINVLKGDMSLVGPRPEVRKYVELYDEVQRKVLSVRPGLTDYASIEYFNENEILSGSEDAERTYVEEIMPRKLSLALKYVESQSFMTDLKILAGTIRRILS